MMLSVVIEGSKEECGFIEISEKTTVNQARKIILDEIEGIPPHFRFLVKNQLTNSYVKISAVQEAKKMASILLPAAILRTEGGDLFMSMGDDDISSSQEIKEEEDKKFLFSSRPLTNTFVENFENTDQFLEKIWNAYSEGKEIIIDEVPLVVFYALGMPIDATSEAFIGVQNLVINLGPNAFGSDDKETYENPKHIFFTIIKTFAPLKGFMDRLLHTMKMEEFFGNLTSAAAEKLIKTKPNGVYLVRLSSSSPGSFAVTVKSDTVHHYLITRTPDYHFILGGGKHPHDSLEEVLLSNKKRLNLQVPCKGSPFRDIFHIENIKRRYTTFEE